LHRKPLFLRLVRLGVALGATMAAAAVAEGVFRVVDGYSLRSVTLARIRPSRVQTSSNGKWMDTHEAGPYVSALPVAAGVERDWYALDPEPPRSTPVDVDLNRRYWAARDHELPSVYQWNLEFIRTVLCDSDRSLHPYLAEQFKALDDVYVFEPTDGAPYPTYRFLPNAHYPSGLVTNSFGWRGTDVPLNKPAGRVRIAFVGASTTADAHGDPFSYPEYIGRWLREWSRQQHPATSFDVINAGREGILSNSIAAIVRRELVPLNPDVVVYYEGANQFWPASFASRPVVQMFRMINPSSMLERHSAVGARLSAIVKRPGTGAEPRKPPLAVAWPSDLDERDPALNDPRLPVQLPEILHDVDRMRAAVEEVHGTFVMSSFVWLVDPGLVLDPRRDAFVFRELNERYWPFSYAHMRRFIDFENRVFAKYARENNLPFNDVAATYPRDPRLFVDSIHMTPAGIKLKAWVVFQNLVPVLEQRLRDGTLPLPDPGGRRTHPAFAEVPRRPVSVSAIAKGCGVRAKQ
jgi:hypothetical protein